MKEFNPYRSSKAPSLYALEELYQSHYKSAFKVKSYLPLHGKGPVVKCYVDIQPG